MTTVQPFEISISTEVLDDLQKRLRNTRWTDEAESSGWDYGTSLGYLKNLVQYWSDDYDWKKQEAILNKLNHYKAEIDGFSLHFIYEKSKKKNAMPIVLLHGWPSSFLLMLKLLPLLIDSFDVIIPSLPGFGFSDQPNKKGMNMYEMGQLLHKLITKELGYEKYAIRCTDTGHGVAREIALSFPESVIGLHTEGSGPAMTQVENMTQTEENFIKESQQLMQKEGSYFMIQSTKPQSLAYGLNDSPVGLAAWMVEKYRAWSDCKGDVETRFSKDDLLTTITLYWVTQSINSSIRHYYELSHTPSRNDTAARVKTPTAIFTGSGGPGVAPKEWEKRFFNVQQWNQYDKGGHFRDWEEPAAVAKDIKTFFMN
jgi:pimeloyl-ACP methyl ester carboxylesterase